jgi:hypothetical protein
MVAHDFRDAQQQASISWVHLAKIFAFVLKENDAFMEAVKLDLEENYAKTLVKTNVWAFFLAKENADFFAYVEKIHSRGVQDNQFVSCNDQSRPQIVPQSTRDGEKENLDETREAKTVPCKEALLVKQRRLVTYVCRSSIQNQGIQLLQTIVILQELFKVWPALEIRLQDVFDEHIDANKKKTTPYEMESRARTKQPNTRRILDALKRTWHGNLLKFPHLKYLKSTLAKWRTEETAKGMPIESFSSQHSYHMERLREEISAWYIYENSIWPLVWRASNLLTETHRKSIERLVREHVGTVTTKPEADSKQERIQAMTNDKSLTVKKLKEMCASSRVPLKAKSTRKGLIEALVDESYPVEKKKKGTTSYNLQLPQVVLLSSFGHLVTSVTCFLYSLDIDGR